MLIEGLYYYYYYCVNSGRHWCMCRQNGDGAIVSDVVQFPREKHTVMDSAALTTLYGVVVCLSDAFFQLIVKPTHPASTSNGSTLFGKINF